jgi:hypothetical protein
MMIVGEIKCPACEKMVGSLSAWRQINGHYFHLCDDCIIPAKRGDMSVAQYVLIGFHYGYQAAMLKVEEFVEEYKNESEE